MIMLPFDSGWADGFMAHIGRTARILFGLVTVLTICVLVLVSSTVVGPSIYSPGLSCAFAYLLVVSPCWVVSAYVDVGLRWRVWSGFGQSLAIASLFVEYYRTHQRVLGWRLLPFESDSLTVLCVVLILVVGAYTIAFTWLTRWFSSWRLGNRASESAGVCPRCGYSLTGLVEPRCPECATPFDPSLLPGASAILFGKVEGLKPPVNIEQGESS